MLLMTRGVEVMSLDFPDAKVLVVRTSPHHLVGFALREMTDLTLLLCLAWFPERVH